MAHRKYLQTYTQKNIFKQQKSHTEKYFQTTKITQKNIFKQQKSHTYTKYTTTHAHKLKKLA